MKTYFKKVAVNAIQYLDNINEVLAFTENKAVKQIACSSLNIGEFTCNYGDYITKETISGEVILTVYRLNIFEQNHIII